MKDKSTHNKIFKGTINALFQRAAPFLDIRDNDVHVQISYEFAGRLLKCYPGADQEIVLPAIILHDIGWKTIPEEELFNSFGPKMKDNTNQRRHETEGAKMADDILSSLGFPRNKIDQITSIINGHDTRLEALSLNDQLVKDADKLWRFTPTGVDIDHKRFGIKRDEYVAYLDTVIEQWMFTPEAKEMAQEALNQVKEDVKGK
ncbi:MAG: HD domain-containing protein [Deltaproteobacteria bacterium]|nr:HD domain-containing protein [Deltaproteobacteria bacterium]